MSVTDTAVSCWLSNKHINVLPEWIQACLEWIHNELQEQDLQGDRLKQMVYDQWLDSDLAEIATPCLPQGLVEQEKLSIQGSFTLQINSIQDVGSSAYSQLIKIKGKENENVSVTATQATQNRFEMKPNRMLMMEITDGHQKVQAMEYQNIPALTPDTPPGTKILIHGSITCRLGVLTLTSRDVKVLGGEVEALVEENNQEKLLARLLGTSLDDLPQQSVNHRQPVNESAPTQPLNQGISQPERRNNKNSSSVESERNNHQQRGGNQWQSNGSQQTSNRGSANSIQQTTGDQRRSSDPQNQSKPESNPSTVKCGWVNDPGQDVEFDDDLDDLNAIDEEVLREFEEAQYQDMSKNVNFAQKKPKPPPEWPSDEDTDEEMLAAMIDKLEEQIKATDKQPKKEKKLRGSKEPKINRVKPSSSIPLKADSNSSQGQTSINSFLKPRQSKVNPVQTGCDVPASNHDNVQSKRKLSLKQRTNSTSQFIKAKQMEGKTLPFATKESCRKKENDISSPEIEPLSRGVFVKEERTCSQSTTEPTIKFCSPERTGSIQTLSAASPRHPKVAIATRITKEEDSETAAKRRRLSSGKDSTEEAPFTYLAEMMETIRAPQVPLVFDIRGFIMTLLSSLGKKSDHWSLTVRLNDGSASLDVVLGDEVLQSLIGYSVTEMKQMRVSVKNNEEKAAVELKQKNALDRCRRRLIDLCEIMTVRVTPGEMPTVIGVRRVEQRDCQLMRRCLHS